MLFLYNLSILFYKLAISTASLFGNQKAKKFIHGRKQWQNQLSNVISKNKRNVVWLHASSLGEFEQAIPLLEKIKSTFPNCYLVVTFFSPSGYEIRKNYPLADYVAYLPLDTKQNAKTFIQLINPKVALFVKYDIWCHYLSQLKKNNIPVFLFSAVFQERQIYFKSYGNLHRKMLHFFHHIFVQDQHSERLLESINFHNSTTCGDTRIDRVYHIAQQKKNLEWINDFKQNKKLLVLGSSWEDDEMIIQKIFSLIKSKYKLLIAPHNVDTENIEKIAANFQSYPISIFSNGIDNEAELLIVDKIGMLSSIYYYADVVWIGGGFKKSGIHNTLEPAVYGLPIFIGPNYQKFEEAKNMIANSGMISTEDPEVLKDYLLNKNEELLEMGKNNAAYIQNNLGAVDCIFDQMKLEKYLETIS